MQGSITNRQMVFILFLTLTTYTTIDLPKIMAQTAGRSSWIPILFATLVFCVAAIIITKLNNMFQGKVLFDYSREIVGKFFTYVIAIYYALYFLIIGVYLKIKLIGMLKSNFLPLTPEIVVLFFGIMLFGYVAYKGITNVARMFEILGLTFLLVTVAICMLMLLEGTKFNVLPFFKQSDVRNYPQALPNLVTSFGGIEVLLIIPFTAKNKHASKTAFATVLFIGLFYVLVVESTIMILGINNTLSLNDSFIEAVKLVYAPVFERMDIFYLTFGLSSLFGGLIMVFIVILEYACRLLPKVKRVYVTIALCILIFILCLIGLSIKDVNEVFERFGMVLILISSIGIPSILLSIARIKNTIRRMIVEKSC